MLLIEVVFVGLDRLIEEQYKHALKFFGKLPHHRVLWNDGPRLKALDEELQAQGLAPKELNGEGVWYCMLRTSIESC